MLARRPARPAVHVASRPSARLAVRSAALCAAALLSAIGTHSARADDGGPSTPDRPGRVEVTDPSTMSDSDLTEETAKELGIEPPSHRIDQQILRWGGLRPMLESNGITFAGVVTADFSKNTRGGLDTETDASRYLLDLRLTLDTKPLFNWAGGTFSVDFQQQGGRNGSDILTGDVQGYDNADADGRTQIAELWYEQLLLDNRLRIKVGKVDANSEFALPQNASAFMNSSFGHAPTLNPWMPTYPDGSTSANVFIYPERWVYAGVGVYDGAGAQRGLATGSYGPSKLWHSDRSLFYIGEAGLKWVLDDNTLPGRVAVGAHYSDGNFEKFDGGEQSGAAGYFVVVDQKLWHQKFYDKGNENGVYGFFQYGHADGRVTETTDYLGAGVNWVGPYQKVNPDTVGVGVAAAKLTTADGAGFGEDWEVSFEGFYNFQITQYLSVKPDLQYIHHPGGVPTVHDALVATLRVTLAF